MLRKATHCVGTSNNWNGLPYLTKKQSWANLCSEAGLVKISLILVSYLLDE